MGASAAGTWRQAPSDIVVDYRLVGAGWAECSLDVYGSLCSVSASYLSDALLELVSGVNHVLAQPGEARFGFDEEPGEFRWILRSESSGSLNVRILEFGELWGNRPDVDGRVLFDAVCPVREFALALLAALDRLLKEFGVAGYRRKWVAAEFPAEQYELLCRQLGRRD